MSYTAFLICIALTQFSSAQVVSYVQRSSVPQQIVANVPPASNAKAVPNNAITVARAVPVASNPVASANGAVSNANLASANLANANIANANIANINAANGAANHNIATGNYAGAGGYASAANYATAANHANAAYASHTAANSYTSNSGIIPTPVNTNVNPIVNNAPDASLAVISNGNLPTINGNIATFNLGTNGNTFTVTSGSPGAQGFGISVIADALEVGGTLAVNGQIPIFGTVAVNGNVPTDGSAAVNYNCGGKQVALPHEPLL